MKLWQCGTYTIKDGKQYKIQTKDLCKQAKVKKIQFFKKYIVFACLPYKKII